MKKIIIGVMGPGAGATITDEKNAYELGRLIAQKSWVLLTGGRNIGVMEAASQGAKSAHGLTVGILPDADSQRLSSSVDIAIMTDMGNGRNNINVLSSDVVIACGMGIGTLSEIALALKNQKPVILLNEHPESQVFFSSLATNLIWLVHTPEQAIQIVQDILESHIKSV